MLEQFKRLGKHIFVYGLGNVLRVLLGIFLLPLFTRYLTTYDYGIIAVISVFNLIIGCIYDFGLNNAVSRYYFSTEDVTARNRYIGTAFGFALVVPLLFSVIIAYFSGNICELIFKDAKHSILLVLSIFTLYVSNLQIIPMAVFRIQERSLLFSIINLARVVCNVGMNVYFIVLLNWGVFGYFLAGLVTNLVILLIVFFAGIKNLSLHIDTKKLTEMLKYGAPFILALLAFWVIDSSDRYIIKFYMGVDKVGVYSMGYTLAMGVNLLVGAFGTAWPPFYMSNLNRQDSKQLFRKVLNYYLGGIMFVVVGFSLFSKELLLLLTNKNFMEAASVMPLISFSYALKGVYLIVIIGLYVKYKTIYQFYIEGFAAVLNVISNIILVPRLGLMGAAVSTLLSYITLPLLTAFICQRLYPVKYDFGKIILMLFVSVLLLSGWFIGTGSIIFDIILKTILIMLYPFILWIGNVIEKEEKLLISKRVSGIILKYRASE